jgi:MFS family permease
MIVFAVVVSRPKESALDNTDNTQPLFGAVASDIGGRKLVYMVGLGSYLIANVLLAVLPANIGLLFILRIFQALGSCIVFSVGAGTVADIVEPAKRASALAIFLLGVQLAPAFGPLIGSLFVDESRWRWIFGSLALTCFPVYLAILFCVPETLRSLVGNGAALAERPLFTVPKLRTKPCVDVNGPKIPRPSFRKFMRLLKYPPHLIVSFNGAFQFAGLYSMYVSFPKIWTKVYHWSTVEVGYAYLVPGISMFIASIVIGRVSDILRKKAVAKSPDGETSPESRIAYQIPGFVISGLGKFMLGWFCHKQAHPFFPLFGSALAAVGTSIVFVTSTSFQTECDPTQTASLVAVGGFLRNVAAALAAVAMESLINSAGYGWTFSIFGLMDCLCIPGILLIIFKGADMRAALKAQQARG